MLNIPRSFKPMLPSGPKAFRQEEGTKGRTAKGNSGLPAAALIEVDTYHRLPQEAVCDRSASPSEDPMRRPSHADRRKPLQRQCLDQEVRRLAAGQPLTPKIQEFVGRVIRHAS